MKQIVAHGPVIKQEIKKYIASKESATGGSDSWRADFLKRLMPFATTGKLLRGSLICFSYQAFSDQAPDASVLNAAVAMELIHSGLLIHDDVMDKDDFRRGKPSIHRQYETAAKRTHASNPEQFGENMAICGGDMCLFMALELLSDAPKSVNTLFTDYLCVVCDGQMQDIYLQAHPSQASKRTIYQLMKNKTAAYTVTLPLVVGGTLAGQPPTITKQLRLFGDVVGTIFQIRDDELGVLGNTQKTGKPVGADIREGKKTLIYYYLMQKCDMQERRELRLAFGNPNLNENDIAAIQKLIRKYHISQLLNQEVQNLRDQALKTLQIIGLPRRYETEFKSLLSFCAKRQI